MFQSQCQKFLSHLELQIPSLNWQIPLHWSIDHLCYRVDSLPRYSEMKKCFSEIGEELAESQVNGRPIATYRLHESVVWKDWRIDLLELPAPKPGKTSPEGFEHVEVVADLPFDELEKIFSSARVDASGLNKSFNQELEIQLENCAVKFHHLSLESVVRLERNEKVFSAIQKLGILKSLRKFEPLIAGTFALGIETENSDVDVLVGCDNLEQMLEECQQFSALPGFEKYLDEDSGEKYALCRFVFEGVPFEIFGQRQRSVKQRAYKHFQVEERLLKLGGDRFRREIQKLRGLGEKTEPAFAKVLQLQGDPFLALLELHGKPESELTALLQV